MVDILRHKDVRAALVFLILGILYLLPGFLSNQIIWGYDTPKIIFPLEFLLSESFKNLQIPLWTPDIFFGFPIGSEGQIGQFYIFNLLHILLPLQWALLLLSLLHIFLAGFFTYIFGRLIGISRFGALLSGIIFMFNGFIIAHFQYYAFVYAYTYLPLIMILVELGIQKNKTIFFLLAGIALGFQFLTGHPNIPVMTFIFAFFYILLKTFKNKEIILKSFVPIIGVAILVALPWLVLTRDLVDLSIRAGGVDFADATNSSFSFYDFITFLFPNFYFANSDSWPSSSTWHFWSYWGQIETTGYEGIMTLFLIPFALTKGMFKKTWIFCVLLLTCLIFALGKHTPVYSFLLNIPILNGLRAPGRFLFLVDFTMAVLAGFGATVLFQSDKLRLRVFKILVVITVLIYSFVLIGSYWIKFYPDQIYNFIANIYSKLGYVANLENIVLLEKMIHVSIEQQTQVGLLLLGAGLLIVLLICKNFKTNFMKSAIILFIIADLFIFASKVNIWNSFDDLTISKNPLINNLKEELSYEKGRVYTFSDWSDLMPNQLSPYHIPEANGFASLPLKRFEEWKKLAEQQWLLGNGNIFKSGSIKYVYDKGNLIPINDFLPRAYFTNRYITSKSKEETFNLLSQPLYNPKVAVVESDSAPSLKIEQPSVLEAKIQIYQPDYVKILSHSPDNGMIVLTDTNFPGWEVFVNKQKTKIYQTNYLFRGVFISKGINEIEFYYRPRFLKEAIIVSATTILIIIFIGFKKILE